MKPRESKHLFFKFLYIGTLDLISQLDGAQDVVPNPSELFYGADLNCSPAASTELSSEHQSLDKPRFFLYYNLTIIFIVCLLVSKCCL